MFLSQKQVGKKITNYIKYVYLLPGQICKD